MAPTFPKPSSSSLRPWQGITPFRFAWTAFIVLATSAPYLFGWLSTPPGFHYTWILPPYPEDSFAYMSWSRQSAFGAWLFKIKYTALPHQAFLFNPFFLVCGWISSIFSGNIGIVFLVVKAMGVILFFMAFYKYADYLGLGVSQSIAASLLLGVSSGFGGILILAGQGRFISRMSADLWMPEINTYWSLLSNPLYPFSLTLMLLSIYWLDRGTREGYPSDIWLSGLSTGGMALIHPYSQPVLLSLAVTLIVARRRSEAEGYLCRFFAAALPALLYVVFADISNGIVRAHSALGEMDSPPVYAYILGLGFPLLLCIPGLIAAPRTLLKRYWPLILWFSLSIVLAYFPFWFQRKLLFGAHIPLCIVAGASCGTIVDGYLSKSKHRWLPVVVAVICLPLVASTAICLAIKDRREIAQNKDGSYFISDDVMRGLEFLRARKAPQEVVFADYMTSRFIPAYSGNTVVWGHWAQSVDLAERQKWWSGLLNPQFDGNDRDRLYGFWGTDIEFVFADGELKQQLETDPSRWRFILIGSTKVFEDASVGIYQRPASLPTPHD